jgi:hypothetical protein
VRAGTRERWKANVKLLHLAALALAGAAAPAFAGPPYLTDDPIPTDTGHWEIYAFTAGEGHGSTLDQDAGFDLNYGPVKGIQLTATLPLSFSHSPQEGWRSGTGDVELGVKYRFFNDEKSGVSVAIFPRAILPTAAHSPDERTRFLLPLWVGKDFTGGTSIFGGGGFTISPGNGNRNFWQAAIAVTHDMSKTFALGAEIAEKGPEEKGGTAQTRIGIGSIIHFSDHYALLVSGGPTWADHQRDYRFYAATGFFF